MIIFLNGTFLEYSVAFFFFFLNLYFTSGKSKRLLKVRSGRSDRFLAKQVHGEYFAHVGTPPTLSDFTW